MDIRELQTPCFVLNEKEFENNIRDFKKILDEYFPSNRIGYSFKTNSLPYIIRKAQKIGCYAEVVSDTEYLLAKQMGYTADRIIFNGPIKGKDIFKKAFAEGTLINIDSMREIEWLEQMSKHGVKGKIGIRINIDLESILPGQTSTGDDGGRFGFGYENGNLHTAILKINEMQGIQIKGVHMHVSNKSKSPEVYQILAKKACEIAEDEKLELEYIDIGGGFFGGGDQGASYKKYVEAIHDILCRRKKQEITLIVEPGASVIATAVDYVTEIIDKKDTVRNRFVITDGSRLHIDPFFHKQNYQYSVITSQKNRVDRQVICGFTCMEKDRLLELKNEYELEPGDKIIYHIVGGYTMCFNSLFIEYLPTVYVRTEEHYTIVREKWGVTEFLQKCKWE